LLKKIITLPKQNEKKKTWKISGFKLGAGYMSISANYGPPADKEKALS